jgi:hypothetical protein
VRKRRRDQRRAAEHHQRVGGESPTICVHGAVVAVASLVRGTTTVVDVLNGTSASPKHDTEFAVYVQD